MPHFMWKVGWHPERLSASGKCNTNKLRCYPQQLESFCVFAIKSAYAIKIKRLCHNKLSAYAIKKTLEPFGISQSICTRTLRNLTRYLHRNPPEPHQAPSPPKPSATSQGLCTGTFRNLKVSAPEPSGTSPRIFT